MPHSKYFASFYARLLVSQVGPGHLKVFLSRYTNAFNKNRRTYATADEMMLLDHAVQKIQPRCLPEHEAAGIKFLLNKLLTPKGNLRNTEHSREFDASTAVFLQSHKHNLEIHWVNCRWLGSTPCDTLAAVFRVRSTSPHIKPGMLLGFSYCATSWQSGGHFEITAKEYRG